MQNLKLVMLGDGAVGKTCTLISFTTAAFPTDYVPTVFDNYAANLMVDGVPVSLGLWDTVGGDDYDRLRPLSYPQTDVFVLEYDVMSLVSLENVRDRWIPEIQHHCPGVPFIVCGNKADLRNDDENYAAMTMHNHHNQPVEWEDGYQVAVESGASGFLEISALTQMNLRELFDSAIRVGLNGPISQHDNRPWWRRMLGMKPSAKQIATFSRVPMPMRSPIQRQADKTELSDGWVERWNELQDADTADHMAHGGDSWDCRFAFEVDSESSNAMWLDASEYEPVYADSVILAARSNMFADILGALNGSGSTIGPPEISSDVFKIVRLEAESEMNGDGASSSAGPLCQMESDNEARERPVFSLIVRSSVSRTAVVDYLKYLYTGKISDVLDGDLRDIESRMQKQKARITQLENQLVQVRDNGSSAERWTELTRQHIDARYTEEKLHDELYSKSRRAVRMLELLELIDPTKSDASMQPLRDIAGLAADMGNRRAQAETLRLTLNKISSESRKAASIFGQDCMRLYTNKHSKMLQVKGSRNRCINTDITLVTVCGHKIAAHRAVLSARSRFFRGFFRSYNFADATNDTITMFPDCGSELALLVEWLYTGKVSGLASSSVTDVASLMRNADKLLEDGLRSECEDALVGSVYNSKQLRVDFDNVFMLYEVSSMCHAAFLESICLWFIGKHYYEFEESQSRATDLKEWMRDEDFSRDIKKYQSKRRDKGKGKGKVDADGVMVDLDGSGLASAGRVSRKKRKWV